MRRTPLKRESNRRRDSRPERERVAAATFKRAGYRCEAAELVPEVECRGGLDPDEIILRSGYRDGHLDPTNTQALCRAHHNWKHDNDDAAWARGLRLWSTERETAQTYEGGIRTLAAIRQTAWLAYLGEHNDEMLADGADE